MSETILQKTQAMTPDQVREFIRDVGIAWENNIQTPHSAYEIVNVIAVHGTMVATAMARAFIAQPHLRERGRRRA